MNDYNDLHRLFLQAMQDRAVMAKEGAIKALKSHIKLLGFETAVNEAELSLLIQEINLKISTFGMEIKELKCEITGKDFIVLVNLIDNSSVMERIDHIYSTKERTAFRKLLEAVVRYEPYGTISTTEALNLQVQMRPGEIQDLIEQFVGDKWFIHKEGKLIPAPRLIAEFDTYLKKNFHDYVQVCQLCSNVVFYGVLCPGCENITHKHCFLIYNTKRKNPSEKRCPACKETILGEREGEEAAMPSRKRQRSAAENGHSPDTPDNTPSQPSRESQSQLMESQEETPGPSHRTGPASARGRRKRRSQE